MPTPERLIEHEGPDYSFGNGETLQTMAIERGYEGLAHLAPREIVSNLLPEGEHLPRKVVSEKLVEIRDNLSLIEDPTTGLTFEISVANKDAMAEGGSVVQVSTSNSTLPDNPSNAVELAYNAIFNPDKGFVYVASPGNGGSTALSDAEQKLASSDGRLIEKGGYGGLDLPPPLDTYQAFSTIRAMARALETLDGKVTHLSADASGAHYSSALMSALPKGQVERVFLYNPTNISDLSRLAYWMRMGKEIINQNKYAEATTDSLALTQVKRDDAKEILGEEFGTKATQIRSGTFGAKKMAGEAQIYRRGPRHGNPAEAHILTGLQAQPDAKVTYVFPEYSAQYKDHLSIIEFIESVSGSERTYLEPGIDEIDYHIIPVGQYWHSHHPQGRLALQAYAFNR